MWKETLEKFKGRVVEITIKDGTNVKGKLHNVNDYFYCMHKGSMCRNVEFRPTDVTAIRVLKDIEGGNVKKWRKEHGLEMLDEFVCKLTDQQKKELAENIKEAKNEERNVEKVSG